MKTSFFLVLVSSALTLSAALPRPNVVPRGYNAVDTRDETCPDGRSGYNCTDESSVIARDQRGAQDATIETQRGTPADKRDDACPDGRSGYNCEPEVTTRDQSGTDDQRGADDKRDQVCPAGRSGYNCEIIDS
ncbi:hypothetical protein BJ166DRAFT_512949 [Pestalotiopsis sp. NC0098]|nr:hypothetical protein BJ166DRAFT_512949 [Pestalotiopsis sp. NC0098]